jgi:hypothetical protein
MPESIPLRTKKPPILHSSAEDTSRSHAPPRPQIYDARSHIPHVGSNDISIDSGRSSPVVVSGLTSRHSSPFADASHRSKSNGKSAFNEPESPTDSLAFDDWDEHDAGMPSDLRPELEERGHRAPLLGKSKDEDEGSDNELGDSGLMGRSTHHFHERDPETQAKLETRKKYTYAAITLALSLVSFTVQTETAVYIQHQLKWEKPFCMLYVYYTPS